MQVGDFLLWRDEQFGHHRAWKVEAVLLGTETTEGLVELRPMFKVPGMNVDGVRQETVLVPEVLTRGLARFGGEGCGHVSGWLTVDEDESVSSLKRGRPCPKCNPIK